jgi:methionyl-tRNA formyltransferase
MKVLILSNPHYQDFLSKIVEKNRTHSFFIYWQSGEYEFMQPWSYDVGISFMYQYKVPAKEVNTHTWFNFHPAPLPEYKGRNLCYHAIMNGEKMFGATLHYMDEGFDTGDIIEVVKQYMFPSDTAEDLSKRTIELSKTLFRSYFHRIIAGEKFERHPNIGGTYYKKEPISDFIDMNYQTVESFDRSVRAITYKEFYPKINIGGVTYKVVRE